MAEFANRIFDMLRRGEVAFAKIVSPPRQALLDEIEKLAGDAKQDWRSDKDPPPGCGHFVTDVADKQIAIFKYIGVNGKTTFRAKVHDAPSRSVGVEGLSGEMQVPDNAKLQEIFATLESRYNKSQDWIVPANPAIPWSVYY